MAGKVAKKRRVKVCGKIRTMCWNTKGKLMKCPGSTAKKSKRRSKRRRK